MQDAETDREVLRQLKRRQREWQALWPEQQYKRVKKGCVKNKYSIIRAPLMRKENYLAPIKTWSGESLHFYVDKGWKLKGMGLDQRERERERGGAAHEIARLAEGTLVSYLYRSGKLWSSARSNQISRSDVLDVVDCTNVLTSTELHCAETEKCPILKLSWWTQWSIVLTRQYEERGTLLAKSKVGRNPENPRYSWLLLMLYCRFVYRK